MKTPHHFEVHGPRRDYDYTPFCSTCHTDALECAQEWMAEVFDALEPGEDCEVEIRCVEGEIDDEGGCYGDSCKREVDPAEHVVAHDGSQKPFGFECLNCGEALAITLPTAVDVFASLGRAFAAKHRDCPAPSAGGHR